ncbi:dihydrodipicolinate synthase family protein [Ponticoccus sp. SC2-23]|uniref:dihydrodipicolinate synthase family protein n=1 Tax=Alexandriicola marinus TaxID=2081710 RepID=UPI000FD7401A|nr:dihydrodipicolinate synthase family protein [Alexandriicola marinus]MBM1218678.1 dihydrodipicolinate synthase family protein [Ponticoccus sp. SC6-9]MBM1224250.1 dihydrodipicolinate synthase family protein [Ponticoccus sp. SC6-15]MBM1229971.1 dihydrodipicolinate synthase family protein [Ponticoccus sp. SC6-38]MBM1233216.1 dihydrodipicolinate synthase family protein [Ponticoccus sp. SC6-45]MBM1236834.1 dihydrodipicolinate synthase family protein [Ponticoccus sp. SC6-49]MBM1242227.1 dihydrodi
MVRQFKGIHAVLFALYDAEERLDRAAMSAQLAWVRAAGAEGVVVLGLATEVGKLTEAEKRQVIDWAAEDRGDLPLGVTITGNSVAEQAALAAHATDAGADWLILQPPLAGSYSAAEYLDFFARVGAELAVPFAVQNAPQYLGRSLSGDDLANLAARCPGFTHVKAETSAGDLAGLVALAGDRLTVLNGRGGLEMTDCLRAGCDGFIVAPDVLPGVLSCMALWRDGDEAGAEAAYAGFLPAATFAMQSLEHLACYGKRIFGARAGITIHDRAPALRPTEAGLTFARRWAVAGFQVEGG